MTIIIVDVQVDGNNFQLSDEDDPTRNTFQSKENILKIEVLI